MIKLSSPVAQVKKIIANRAVAQFCDQRHDALILAALNYSHNPIYKLGVNAGILALVWGVAFIDE